MPQDTRKPQEILAQVTASRVALTSSIYGLGEEELTTKSAVGHWSVKDVMAHLGRWEEICFDELQKHLHGERSSEDYRDALAYNDKWEAQLQSLALQEAIESFETAHYRLFGFLSSLKPEQWNGYVRAWVRGSTWHHFEAWRADSRMGCRARIDESVSRQGDHKGAHPCGRPAASASQLTLPTS